MIDQSAERHVVNAALGLADEAGAIAHIVKRAEFLGRDLDREALATKLGDAAWYIAQACEALNVSLDAVLAANITRTSAGYPGK
jgi:NTP pyrophosphatase (non-canonical NTP hydrolase)